MRIDFTGFLWSWLVENVLRAQFPQLYELLVNGETTVAPIRLQVRSRVWVISGLADGNLRVRREA